MHWEERKYRFKPPLLPLLLLLSLSLLGCTSPIPPLGEDDLYEGQQNIFPMKQGNIWVYSSVENPDAIHTYFMESIQSTREGTIGSMLVYRGDESIRLTTRWLSDRLLFSSVEIESEENSLLLLHLPLRPGRHWVKINSSLNETINVIECQVISTDTIITVPAGTFNAVLVREVQHMYYPNSGEVYDTAYTAYAKDVGMISLEALGVPMVLESFTPGVGD